MNISIKLKNVSFVILFAGLLEIHRIYRGTETQQGDRPMQQGLFRHLSFSERVKQMDCVIFMFLLSVCSLMLHGSMQFLLCVSKASEIAQ